MSDRFELFLTCPKGLEGLLIEEAVGLGLEEAREHTSAVRGMATMETAYRLCLWSRLANRVLLVLKRFPMKDAEDLYHGVLDIEWQDQMLSDGTLAVEFSGHGSGIDNTHFGALKVKDAIVDKLRTPQGDRPSIDKLNPDLRIHLRLDRGEAILSLDLSGHSLHQRGYRLQQGAAPLKENLAAAILIRSGWPRIAAAGLAKPPLWIRGYEADPRLIQPGRNNVERAGLSEWIKIYQGEVATFEPRPDQNQKGLVICNPPYGERLGDEASLLYLYQNLGERLRQACLNWEAAVFTGAPDLGKRMGIRSHKQYSFWNGALPCKLLLIKVLPDQFVTGERRTPEQRQAEREQAAYDQTPDEPQERKFNKNGNPIKPTPAPAPVIEQPRLSEGGQMFANRLQKNLKAMGKWVKREGIDCYRVYDADMPEYAMAIDLYHDWVHVQEYAAPKSIDPEKASARMFDALAAIPQALNVDKSRVVVKRRERQSGTKQYERQAAQGKFNEVSEGGVKLLVNLTDYLDTGLFLDHRPMRMRIQKEAAGKRFLNLFCYTATASVHAAKGGARSTTSVDLSKTYLDWARRNLSLNGYSDKNRLEQGDVMAWLESSRDEYDLIFIDPPTFSNSKRMEGIFDVQRDQVQLIDLAMARLAPGGVLYFSNNFRKFQLEENLAERYAVEEISAQTIDPDFARNTKIHRAWKITAR